MSVSLRALTWIPVALSLCTVLSLCLAACDKKKERHSIRDREEDDAEEERARARRAKSPERLCDRLAEMENKKRKKQDRPPLDPEKDIQKCVRDLTTMREQRPQQYECIVPCMNNGDDDRILECFMDCLLKEPVAAPSSSPTTSSTTQPPQPELRKSSDPFGLD